MSKMTESERQCAGWQKYYAVRIRASNDYQKRGWAMGREQASRRGKDSRDLYATAEAAQSAAAFFIPGTWPARVTVWVRKKPKPAPDFKVGDEVMVRGKLTRVGTDGTGLVSGASGCCGWFDLKQDLVR